MQQNKTFYCCMVTKRNIHGDIRLSYLVSDAVQRKYFLLTMPTSVKLRRNSFSLNGAVNVFVIVKELFGAVIVRKFI